jgi:tripartite-type tricarboxylate transporter receptor subunit TctC
MSALRHYVWVIAFLATTFTCAAADYPTRPVTIIVPYTAGGASDVATRILADGLSKYWKQQVFVENKPGGAMIIGMSAVQHAKPDGYTLGFIAAPFAINPALRKNLPYDSIKDFVGVTVFQTSPYGIAGHPGLQANTMKELIEASKTHKFTFATSGVGSGNHMVGELVQNVAGVKWRHVPYNGDADAVADILTGRVDFTVSTWTNLRPLVESGKLKLLAIANPKRLPEQPNVPTLREVFPNIGLDPVAWNGINAPAGLPADILAKIDAAMKAVTSSKEFQDRIRKSGAYPEYRSPAETDATIKREIETWARVVKEQNISIQ